MRETRAYGKHELYIEDDILVSVPHGELTDSELNLFYEVAAEVIARHGHCMMLADSKDAGDIGAATRRRSAQLSLGKPIIGIAFYNASMTARALFMLVIKARNLLWPQPIPFAFFKTEREARDWLSGLRMQHLARVRSGPQPPVQGNADPA